MRALDDTIAAVATALGEGGLAIVRLSGPRALEFADACFEPVGAGGPRPSDMPSHTVRLGHVTSRGKVIDEVMLTVMRAPRTFTREDVVEISSHGGVLAPKMILEALLEQGARLAEPGEFTRRAFLNGRLDLVQAEAVADLIHARTELALRAANEQLAGNLSRRIEEVRETMMRTLAHVEAHIDFPDEDIAPDTREQLVVRLEKGRAFMQGLLRSADEGQILRRGVRAAIIGRPNVGKSSLLNQLLGRDRAIVSPVPGTTRDTIEETANIRGVPVVFIDTAGLRQAADEIESEGIRRSQRTLEQAELVLHVVDASDAGEREVVPSEPRQKQLTVLNKIDLVPASGLRAGEEDFCAVSCRTGEGIEDLKERIFGLVWGGRVGADNLEAMINARHKEALERARQATERTISALRADEPLDLVAVDLRAAVQAVGEIVGKTTTEDLLDAIFSQFCIGK